jgi:Raf kinase inhibitor-like YbhB/YbcL family protein
MSPMNLERPAAPNPYEYLPTVATALTVTSEDVSDGAPLPETHVFDDWGMTGGNESPQLSWNGAPEATQSFAITCFDPDAPTASGWWHWVVVDLPSSVTTLRRGAGSGDATLPGGFHIKTDYGTAAYGGAAPPQGDHPHRYFFAVHALDVESLGVDPETRPAVVGFNLAMHTLARGFVVPTYQF